MPNSSYIPLKPPRGTTEVIDSRTGQSGEIAVDYEAKELVYFDGTTRGGIRFARKDSVAALATEVSRLAASLEDLTDILKEFFEEPEEPEEEDPENPEEPEEEP